MKPEPPVTNIVMFFEFFCVSKVSESCITGCSTGQIANYNFEMILIPNQPIIEDHVAMTPTTQTEIQIDDY